jgi:TolB-like protein/DNA-binding winged helix-turn-helix (wHTH) protein/Tfp pilus assembly protein PilF
VSPDPAKVQDRVRFGEDFEVDLRAYELRGAGRTLKLERIPMEVLLFLMERHGQLVAREEIVKKIWGDGVFLDTDNSINGAIRKIRQVLKDNPEHPLFIQTVTGRGYRFIAPIVSDDTRQSQRVGGALQVLADSQVNADNSSGATLTETPQNERPVGVEIPRTPPTTRRWLILGGVATLLLVSLAGWWLRARAPAKAAPAGRLMLAVLPFQNLTGDPAQEYFSDGLTEEMIAQLGNVDPQRMGVIARTSVMHYKNGQVEVGQIGRDLGVQYVLEGSVRREPGRVRVTAQLIQIKDQTHLWARQYDRELSGLLSVQDEIAREVADEISLTLGESKRNALSPEMPAASASSPNATEAYDLYLKGQYSFNKRTPQSLRQAIQYFEQATEKDPRNARAYAGLADAYALAGGYSLRPQTEFMGKGRAAAVRAVEIDPSLPEAHTALALIVQNYDWDWTTAEREFRRAIELNPNYATAHHWYAEHLMWRGRFDEALRESERARQLDPLSVIIAADNGVILYSSRQYDRSIEKFRTAREMEPSLPRAQFLIAPYAEKGMFAEALADLEAERSRMDLRTYWVLQAYINGRAGRRAEAQRALRAFQRLTRNQPVDAYLFVWAYLGTGDNDKVFAWLEKGYAQHSNALIALKAYPYYDPLRGDPRFQDLLRRVGLAD